MTDHPADCAICIESQLRLEEPTDNDLNAISAWLAGVNPSAPVDAIARVVAACDRRRS